MNTLYFVMLLAFTIDLVASDPEYTKTTPLQIPSRKHTQKSSRNGSPRYEQLRYSPNSPNMVILASTLLNPLLYGGHKEDNSPTIQAPR